MAFDLEKFDIGVPGKKPEDIFVVVAMSGGVDSSVTAALMVEKGYKVVGMTLQLYDHGLALQKKGACCAGQDIYDAKKVCDQLGIKHYVLNYENVFSERVIDDFADSYIRGETPLPCVRCNQKVKFQDLLRMAKELGADCLATGHYIRRVVENDKAKLLAGIDPSKDQSYFLFATTQDQLDYLRFPLGDLTKEETRQLAERYGLHVSDKPDSQDICFVPNGDYASLVSKLRPGAIDPGEIIHLDGRVLGRHEGVIHYTIGQRRGIGIGGIKGSEHEPLYVIKLEPEKKQVIVGPKEALAVREIALYDVNWLGDDGREEKYFEIDVKLRSVSRPKAAKLSLSKDKKAALVTLEEPQYGIAKGQACVFYAGEQVLGGGWL